MKENLNQLFDLYGFAPLHLQAMHEDGKLLICEEDSVSLWSLGLTPELCLRITTSRELTDVLLSPEGSRALLVYFHERRAELWDLESLEIQGNLSGCLSEGLQFDKFSNSNCGQSIFVIDDNKLNRIPWDVSGDISLTEGIKLDWEYGLGVSHFSAQPGGKEIFYIIEDEEAPIRKVIREEAGEWKENIVAEMALEQVHQYESFNFSPTGRYLCSTFRYEPVLIDTRSWEICQSSQIFGNPIRFPLIGFSENDQQLFWRDDTLIKSLDIASGVVTVVVKEEWPILDFAWTREGVYYSTLEERVGVHLRARLRRIRLG